MTGVSYKQSGVDIDVADAAKRQFADSLQRGKNPRVLTNVGAFASVYDIAFKDISDPVMVVKAEEPGSKQLLAAQHGRLPDVAYDLIHHLLNDTAIMGARPLAVVDTIICGKLEKEVVTKLVDNMAEACRNQGCDLIGGETSEQPRVLGDGVYVLSASAFGIVSKAKVIDGSRIRPGDAVLAVASNGVHTNGYTLIRMLLDQQPDLAAKPVAGSTFLDQVLVPHRCYNLALQEVFQRVETHGIAHITGGGLVDNTVRIVPKSADVCFELNKVRILPVFDCIREVGNVSDKDMLRTFNLGVGLVAIMPEESVEPFRQIFSAHGDSVYEIGEVVKGRGAIQCRGRFNFSAGC
jgi:phosphoribosylformylglycinamidine cyclo-ligase